MNDEETDRSAREAKAEVLSERELLALISPDAPDAAGTAGSDRESSTEGAETDTPAGNGGEISQSDSAGPTS